MKKFKHCEIIVFDPKWEIPKKHPLKRNEVVVFIGNIPNVPGHCVVAKHNGKVVWMVHISDFRIATEEEV
jgi:hypothetical protein